MKAVFKLFRLFLYFFLVGCKGLQSSFEVSNQFVLESEMNEETRMPNSDASETTDLPETSDPPESSDVDREGGGNNNQENENNESDREEVGEGENQYFLITDFLKEKSLCSELDFTGVLWTINTHSESELYAFILALNISGSFEGHEGFQNISNNFDGQGLSLGLLNQNFGQGSLQPLMIKTFLKNMDLLDQIFSPAHSESLESMLRSWGEGKSLVQDKMILQILGNYDLPSILDKNTNEKMKINNFKTTQLKLRADNQKSVDWAKEHLYQSGGVRFDPLWKKEMQSLASSPEYVYEQIYAALKLHKRALTYQKELGFQSLGSYLLFFDIAVQNGSLKTQDKKDYLSWLQQGNENQRESVKLKKIIDLRLRHVLSQWREDVKKRKISLVDGQGLVHGAQRDYEKEYCFHFDNSEVRAH